MSVAVTSCGLWLINNSPNALAQTPSAQVKTSKSVASASSTFDAGEEIVFNVAYSCASVLDPVCQNMVITDVIHPNLEFLGTTSLPDGATFNQAGGEVVINLGDIPAGDSRVFQLRARFPLGTLPGITATNQTIADADNANPVTSDIVDVAASSSFLMTANKSVITVPQTGVIGEGYQTTYQLNICNPNNGVGGVALLNPVLTDTLPAEVTPVLPLPYGGIYIPGSPPTSSNLALWQAGVGGFPTEIPVTEGCFTLEFPVEFNSATTGVVSGTVVNNVFTVSGNPADEPTDTVGLGPVGNNVTLRDPYYAASFEKTVASASNHPDDPGVEELPGGPVTYTLTLNNNGTLPISNTVVTDVLPTEIATVTTVGVVPITTGQTVTFSYELDNSGSWILGQTATETTVIDLSSLPGKVTALRWELGTMPFTVTQWSVNVSGNISDTFISGSFDNCGGFTGFSQGSAQADGPDCATVEVIELRAIPRADKQISNSNDVKPGSVVSYTLSVFNDSVAHNDVIAPITLADLLPEELEVVVFDGGSYRPAIAADSWYQIVSQPGGTPAPTVAFTPTYGANNETLLRWQWPGPFQLAPGERIDLTFDVRVKHGTLPGPLDNRSIILWNPATLNPLYCIGNQIYTDTINIDEDGDSVENGCQSDNEPTNVAVYLAMESQKFVLGELDGGIWNKDGLTVPGGQVNYRMHITNLSNITTTNLVVYDIFPFVGDTGNIDTTPRGSDWRPNLQAPIQIPAGIPLSIEYSQSGNPCRPEIFPSGPPGCTDDWSATPPADVTSVQAARFEFCDGGNCLELAPDDGSGNGGSLVLTWIMQAPNDAPNDPERAWNTFGFTAEGGGLNLLPAEPNRVGIRVTRSLTTASLGDYVWLDVYGTQNDGIQQPEESGINGVRVELRDENGDPYDFNNDGQPDYRITGNDADGNPGYYLFVGLDPALTYTVRFYPPVTYTLGPPLAVNYNLSISNTSSTTDGLDSDGITTGNVITYGNYVQTQPITFTPGITVDLTWDQGLWLPTDYGDAPNSYNTRATGSMTPANAARHVILPNIYMGNGVDDELDGTPDPTSFLDDAGDGNDDEDGVVFEYYRGPITQPTPIFIVGDTSDLTVTTVVTVPANYRGYLNAWIDFNRDGDFDDAGEQIATDQQAPVNGGIINVSVSVPATAITGTSYARFRFSTESGLGPSGGARDGEVEDYPLLILPGDYGDLPDGSVSGSPNPPNYPTTSSNDGARHAINPINNPTLGGSVDDELDGQPSRNATGDGADENGVVFTSDIVPGEIMTLTVTASVTDGLLNAWIDFNFDGDFDDLNERLATNQPITAGATITITANVPLTATQALTAYSRFRFSTDANLSPTGLALNGEVEDYAQPILPLDYGDLPSMFPTTYSVDGARHIINTNGNPTLGSRVDAESDGQPNNAASGDDSNNSSFITHGSGSGDDEDGVSFNTLLVPGKVATITVSTLSAGSGGADGLLNAWVDFNNNGAFDPGEQIFTDTNLTAGSTNTLSFVVPSNAVTGTTYLRFRYSSETGLSPSGLALDGEVEDYRTEIVVVDYGDNPDRYGTTDAQNGPYHAITSTLYLGSQVDDELDGQPNDTARGDDQTGTPDDEDGVLFDNYSGTPALPIAIMQLGETSGLTVTTTGSGYLYGWVDLNGDGDFDDAGELVVNGQAVSGAGNTVNVNVNVPSNVTTYTTYARFRLSDKTGLGPVGPQTSGNEFVYGEVEDYIIQLVDANKALSTTAESHTSGSDVAIGEVVQYDITITLPELTINNVRITDTLGTGLQYLTNTVRIAASSGVTTSGVTESGSPFGNGTDPIFNLGTITNANTSPAQSEVLTLTFNALVLNVLANQDGTDLTNGFTVSYDNVVLTSEPVTVTVVEPDFTIDKQIATAPSDAGDVVSYTVTYENTGNTTAFDVTLTDTLPITYLKLDLGSVSISSSGTVTSINNNSSGNTVRVTVGGVAVGATVTVGYSATLTSTVELNQPITNTAYLTYTSLPGGNGTTGNPTGSNPPGSSGNPDGERNGSGGVNDYIITDSEQIEVNISVLTKAITTTSEAHTNFGGGYERLAIGEIVRYRLVFELPEGAAPNLQVQDVLTSNLQFMNDNTVKVAFIANGGGITSTTVTDAAADCPTLLFTGNSAIGIEPTCVLTSTAVSGNVNFSLGTLVNRDNDSDAELVVVEFNALVLNNTDNNRGDILSNLFRVTTDQGTSSDSNTVDVQLVEPVLEISKRLNTTGIDAGDTISYTLSITNTATGNDAAAAFDVVISDTLPSQLTLAVSPTVSTAAVFTDSSSGSLIYVEFDRLDPGQSAEVTITATVASAAINGLAITNTAVVTGTSLPGDGTANNPTGSTTPGASGDNNGERNGSDGPGGTPDDYYDEDDAAFSITSLPPGKTIDSTSAGNTSGLDVTIGEVITYQVTVDLPEGVVPGLTITDDIPVGLAYIPNSVVTDTTSFNGSFSPGDPTITSAGGSGDDLVIAYAGNINVTADNNPANNRLVFTFRTLVTDVVDNVGFGSGQTTLTNTVQLQVGNLPPQTSSAVTATVVEPNMVITKTMDPAEAGALSTTVITLTVANTGLSEAFDVIVEDPIPTTIFSNITPVVTPPGFAFSTIPSGTDTIVRYTGGSIDVNDIVTFVLTAQVTSPITDNLVITNVATITQATTLPGPDPNERNEPPVNDSDTITTLSLSLGNRVWFDADNDGLLDPSESGIDGVVLQLLDSAGNPYDVDPVTPGTQTYTTTTVGGGYYTFTHLLADAYRVRVVNSNFQATGVLSTYVSSADVAGTSNPDGNVDSDDNGPGIDIVNHVTSQVITLTYHAEPTNEDDEDSSTSDDNSNLTVDFGFFEPLRLGNRVWFDEDNDGQLTGGESGAANVIVTLLDGSGGVVNNPLTGQPYTATTNATGLYTFTNLISGTYRVRIDAANFQSGGPLAGYLSSVPTQADPNSDTDSDDNGIDDVLYLTNGIQSGVITLTLGTEPTGEAEESGYLSDNNSNLTIDFGFYHLLNLGNRVWYDVDNDGQKDPSENGIENVVLVLLDGSGQVLTDTLGNPITTTTDSSGFYTFTNLISGTYRVQITATNFLPGGPLEDFISSTPTESNADGDVDNDDNGIDDATPATNGTTSGPISLAQTTEPDTGIDGDGTNGNLTVDFGFFEPLRLGNQVWIDESSRNGQIDGGESGVSGVVLNLLDGSGNPVTDTVTGLAITTTTDGSGFYTFTNLISGTYIVEVDAVNFQSGGPLVGYLSTTPTETDANTTTDSDDNGIDDTDPATNGIRSGTVTLTPDSEPSGEVDENGSWPDTDSNLTVDFGFVRPARLGNYVWIDTDGDGEQDATESGLNGVTVNLWADTDNDNIPDTIVLTTTTAISGTQDGYYEFDNLTPGIAYQVEFEPPSDYLFTSPDQTGDSTDSDADTITGLTPVVVLTPGENNTTIDAGVFSGGIEVEKTVAIAAIVPNQVVTYTITITNTGGVLLNPVQLTDTLEAGLNYISGSASPAPDTVSGQQLIWNDVTAGAGLAPGADTQVSLLVSVTTITGTYLNTALAEGTLPTGTITDIDDVSVIVSDPAVELSKHVVSPGAVNGIITFTIELTNTGPSTLEQVPLFDQFTGPVEYIGGNVVADSIDNTNGVLSWNDLTTSLGDMAPGQVFLIETVFQITADSTSFSMTNFAEVSEATDTFGNEADDDSATVTLDNEPTAIDLLYFRGNRQGENVILNWATAVEIDNFGFRLFRSTTPNRADAVEIAFVPGQGLGTGSGATYSYIDKQIASNQTYTYWLVDIDLDGTATEHSPVTITPNDIDSGGDRRLYLPIILQDK